MAGDKSTVEIDAEYNVAKSTILVWANKYSEEWQYKNTTKKTSESDSASEMRRLNQKLKEQEKEKETFYTILEDGNIELINSRAEQFIKMFVIGRKNFLFSNTPNGAVSTARVYSIIQAALANNLKSQHYLQYVFERIQENPDIDINQILPWSKEIPEYCKNKKGDA